MKIIYIFNVFLISETKFFNEEINNSGNKILPGSLDHDSPENRLPETGRNGGHPVHVHPEHFLGHSLNLSVT